MFEHCTKIYEIESVLKEKMESVYLIGELDLSEQDVKKLNSLIRQEVKNNRDIKTLVNFFPNSFVVFLVSVAQNYNKESFWKEIESMIDKELNLDDQREWGSFFLNYIQDRKLHRFDEEEGYKYVTPLLGHACIPNVCIGEYFEKVVIPIEKRISVSSSKEQIIEALCEKRRINQLYLEFKNIKDVKEQIEVWKLILSDIETLIREGNELLEKEPLYKEFENAKQRLSKLNDEIDNYENELISIENDISQKSEKVYSLEQEISLSLPQIEGNVERVQRLIEKLNTLSEKEHLFRNQIAVIWEIISEGSWDTKYEAIICNLHLDNLQKILVEYKEISVKRDEYIKALTKLNEKQKRLTLPFWLMWVVKILDLFIFAYHHDQKEARRLTDAIKHCSGELEQIIAKIKTIISNVPIRNDLLYSPSKAAELIPKLEELIQIIHDQQSINEEKFIILNELEQHRNSALEIEKFSFEYDDVKNILYMWQSILRKKEENETMIKVLKDEIRELEYTENEIISKIYAIKKEKNELKEKLATIGGGNVEKGIEAVENYQKLKIEHQTKWRDFSGFIKDFDGMDRTAQMKSISELQNVINDHFDEIQEQINSLGTNYNYSTRMSGVYIGIDEPIRRFLLYGDKLAEQWLVESVELLQKAKSGVENLDSKILPQRYINHFIEWWKNYKKQNNPTETKSQSIEIENIEVEEEIHASREERERSPFIFIDVDEKQVQVKLPVQRFKGDVGELILEVWGDKEKIFSERLRLYSIDDKINEVEVKENNIQLVKPCSNYKILIREGEQIIREWNKEGIDKYAIFHGNPPHKLLNNMQPIEDVFFLLHKEYEVFPEECILQEGDELYDDWWEYKVYVLKVKHLEKLIIKNRKTNESVEIFIQGQVDPELIITDDNNLQPRITIDGFPVYCDFPKSAILNNIMNDNFDESKLFLIADDKYDYSLTALYKQGIVKKQERGKYLINLSSEIFKREDTYGLVILGCEIFGKQCKRQDFYLIPNIKLNFDKQIYLSTKKEQEVRAKLYLKREYIEKISFPNDTLRDTGTLDEYELICSQEKNVIEGDITFTSTSRILTNLPIAIKIPKLRWRIVKDNDKEIVWKNEPEKDVQWIEDIFDSRSRDIQIEIEASWLNKKKMSLTLINSHDKVIKDNVQGTRKGDIIAFDLKALEEVCRRAYPAVNVSILIGEERVELLKIQTSWQLFDVKCSSIFERDKITINVKWSKEKGKREGKISAQLYALIESQKEKDRVENIELVNEITIDGQEATFVLSSEKAKVWKYLIHLSTGVEKGKLGLEKLLQDVNSTVIDIRGEEVGKKVRIKKVILDNDNSFKLNADYVITIKGKVKNQKALVELNQPIRITPYNENWYTGEIEVKGGLKPHLLDMSDTNLLKFDYDQDKQMITCIEDRYGDGAYYCNSCHAIFWSSNTYRIEQEVHKHNINSPKCFLVEWI